MKKLYKNTFMQWMLAVCVFSFAACQEYGIDSQPEAPLNIQIDAMDTYSALATSPSNVVFSISSNTPWSITSDQQWCKPTPAMSASSSLVAEIVVALESNPTGQQRVAKLTVKAEGIAESRVITITQVSKEDLVVIPFDEMVPTEGGKISFSIVSNKPWKVIPSTQFLENIDKSTGTGNENGEKETISITLPENAAARRSGTITVKTDFQEYTFTINQDGVVIEQEEPSESGVISFGSTELTKVVKIRSNKVWKVKVPKEYAEWMTAEAMSDSELKITLKESNRLITRKGQVLLSTVEVIPGFEDIPFEIAQSPVFWFNKDDFMIDEATGYVKGYQAGKSITSNYAFKKGHLTFEFEAINLIGKSRLDFNMYPNVGNSNYHLYLQSNNNCDFTCGGSGFSWEQTTFALTAEQIAAIRKIEFFMEDDPEHAGKLRIRVVIDGKEVANLKNKSNCFVEDPANNPGQIVYIQFPTVEEGSYYTVKSITHEMYN